MIDPEVRISGLVAATSTSANFEDIRRLWGSLAVSEEELVVGEDSGWCVEASLCNREEFDTSAFGLIFLVRLLVWGRGRGLALGDRVGICI